MNRPKRKPETDEFLDTLVEHPDFAMAWQAVESSHRSGGKKPLGAIIIGHSGTGKSTLLTEYQSEYPCYEKDDRSCSPIVFIEGHKAQTGKSVMQELLDELGSPYRASATTTDLHKLIKKAFRELDVQLVMYDEFQESRNSGDILRTIKKIMNQTQIPFVLAGNEELADFLNTDDMQIKKRFGGVYQMKPFSITTPDAFECFRAYMRELQNACAIRCNLTEEGMLLRLYLATHGLPGLIANLMERFIEQWDNKGVPTLQDYSDAYINSLVGQGHGHAWAGAAQNPFLIPLSKVKHLTGRL